jgi:hypothetical protein
MPPIAAIRRWQMHCNDGFSDYFWLAETSFN